MRVVDLASAIDHPEPGDAAWTVRAPKDCGRRGCDLDHDGAIMVVYAESEGRLVVVRVGARVDTLFGEANVSIDIVLHGDRLREFFADLDELRRMVGA